MLAKTASSDRRHDGDDAEQADDADMKLGAGDLPLPGEPKPGHLPGDDDDHRQHEHRVDEQHAHHHAMRRHDGREAGQDEIGGKARAQREHHGDQAEREGQPAAASGPCPAGRRRVGTARMRLVSPEALLMASRGRPSSHALGCRLQGLEHATQPHSPALPKDLTVLRYGSVRLKHDAIKSQCGALATIAWLTRL